MLKCPYLKHLSLQLFKIRGHPLKGKSQDKITSLPKKDHIKNIFVFTATTIMLTYLSRIRYFFYFWLRKSSHRTIPHQSPIRIKAVYVTLPFRLSGPENLRYRTMSKQKNNLTDLLALMSNPFWLMAQAK